VRQWRSTELSVTSKALGRLFARWRQFYSWHFGCGREDDVIQIRHLQWRYHCRWRKRRSQFSGNGREPRHTHFVIVSGNLCCLWHVACWMHADTQHLTTLRKKLDSYYTGRIAWLDKWTFAKIWHFSNFSRLTDNKYGSNFLCLYKEYGQFRRLYLINYQYANI
jgi:hypothetical protein